MNYLQKEFYELLKSENNIVDFIQDISLDGLWYWDIENRENKWINQKFWLTLGYNPDEMPDKLNSWQHIIHPDDLRSAFENFNTHNTNHLFDQVIRYTHKNGSTVWMHCKGLLIRDKEGKAIRMLGSHIDITKEKNSEEKHRMLFDSIDEGFCIIEMIFDEQKKPIDYRFLIINASFENQTGLHDAVGKRMREFAPNHEEHWFETYGKIALTGEPVRFENRAEQLHRWYDVYAFRFGDPKNMQVAILFNDITERKKSEETIQLLNKELAHHVLQLEAVNKELESFSYSVSHDLRAPLRAINGYANILEEDFLENLPEEGKKYFDAICKNSQKMGNLIDDLLTFSRLGKKDLVKSSVDNEYIVQGIINEIGIQNSTKKTIFNIKNLPPVSGDATLVKQVWLNLISNAHKYSRNKAAPAIEIGSTKNGDETIFYIKDNGVGFDMKYYNKLFGVFQRLHSEVEFEGTGVGLAIVQRIVTRHGGKVWAEAKLNEGACFYFTIPVLES